MIENYRPIWSLGNGLTALVAAWFSVLLSCIAAAQTFNEQTLGASFHLTPADLPRPYATPSVANGPQRIRRPENATLKVPLGFQVNLFAQALRGPRWLAVASNGDVILSETWNNRVLILRDGNGDGVAEQRYVFSDEIRRPHGLAIHDGKLLVSDPTMVWVYDYRPGQTKRSGKARELTAAGQLGDGGGHSTRNLALSPDGRHLYVAIGSRANVAIEPAPRATVRRFPITGPQAGGLKGETFASGLRNPVGISFHPKTGALYVVVNERDGLGDGLVPDYLTRVHQGEFFGWPYAYSGTLPDPDFGPHRADLVAKSKTPDVLFQAHSAPLGLTFYTGKAFPTRYQSGAFAALHGSWNAARPTGHKIVYVPFKNGRPLGSYENFAVGFWAAGAHQARVWGRPAGLAIALDGSLLIADDYGGAIWRISYKKR